MSQRVVLEKPTQTAEKRWLWNNTFHSTCCVNGHDSTIVTDSKGSNNIVSRALVDRLQLRYFQPYLVQRPRKGNEVQVHHRFQIAFTTSSRTKYCAM